MFQTTTITKSHFLSACKAPDSIVLFETEESPMISKEVLKKAADKTEVLPESIIFEIMAANPDELKNDELIKYLKDKENPLPDYMISILKQLANGFTYKTILKSDMAKYHANKVQAAYDLIRSNLNDTITDVEELRSWLYELDNVNADLQIVSTFMEEGDYASAQSLLNLIPDYYQLEGKALNNFNDYKTLHSTQMNWVQTGKNLFELDSTDITTLLDYAENTNGKASVAAKGLLEFAYGYEYCNCLPTADTAAFKSSGIISPEESQEAEDFGLFVEATPNPATSWVAFNYTLPVYVDKAELKITDITGKWITTIVLNSPIGQKVWNTRKLERGVYLYTYTIGTISKSGKIILN